jgi:Ti-type conjugative transfer relaxase TraA
MTAMGYYHCSVDGVGKSAGRSIVAAAAYRSGERLIDESTGIAHNFERRRGVLASFIVLPVDAPAWAQDRERLWNAANAADPRANARLATELELALPHELSASQRRELVEDFARGLVERYGVAVDVALHEPGEGRDHRNHHAHVVISHRQLGPDGFGDVAHKHTIRKKIKGVYRDVNVVGIAATAGDVKQLRLAWQNAVNRAYREAGLDIEVDARSHRDRGIEREPTQHLGPTAAGIERAGRQSERGDINRDIARRNGERERLHAEAERVSAEIIDLAAEREKRAGAKSPAEHRSPAEVLAQLTERQSVFTWRDVNRALEAEVPDRTARAALTDEILLRPEVIGLRERADAPVSHYTTREVLNAEHALLRDTAALSERSSFGLRAEGVEAAIAGHQLNEEQAQAVRHAAGQGGFAIIAGEAGTGKSRTLGSLRDAYAAEGYRVLGMSWTNSVVQNLRQDGFEATTVAAEFKRLDAGRDQWDDRTLLIVDEAAMLSTPQLASLASRAEAAGAKLVIAGDDRQLSSIERGGMFEPLCVAHGVAELHDVQRVDDPAEQRAFNFMHEGKFREALDIFDSRGAVRWSETEAEALEQLGRQYSADCAADPDKKRFIFAYTNDQVDLLNAFARGLRQERHALGEEHVLQTPRGPALFAGGDRVQFTENAWTQREKEAGLVNGAVGTVVEIASSLGRTRMTVELDGPKDADPQRLSFTVGPNREAGEFDALRHGYAGTIYRGQGRTLDETYVLHSRHWREASSYVALTRHRESTAIFVARETASDLDRLARQMGRDEIKRAATSFIADETGLVRAPQTRPRATDSRQQPKPAQEDERLRWAQNLAEKARAWEARHDAPDKDIDDPDLDVSQR